MGPMQATLALFTAKGSSPNAATRLDTVEELVKLVNEELRSASSGLKERLDTCDAELQDVKTRLSRLYDVLETGKLSLDELAPRIRELRSRHFPYQSLV